MLFHDQELTIAKLKQQEVERKAKSYWKFLNKKTTQLNVRGNQPIVLKHNGCVPIQCCC